jgi:flagellar hook-length control protein FliK
MNMILNVQPSPPPQTSGSSGSSSSSDDTSFSQELSRAKSRPSASAGDQVQTGQSTDKTSVDPTAENSQTGSAQPKVQTKKDAQGNAQQQKQKTSESATAEAEAAAATQAPTGEQAETGDVVANQAEQAALLAKAKAIRAKSKAAAGAAVTAGSSTSSKSKPADTASSSSQSSTTPPSPVDPATLLAGAAQQPATPAPTASARDATPIQSPEVPSGNSSVKRPNVSPFKPENSAAKSSAARADPAAKSQAADAATAQVPVESPAKVKTDIGGDSAPSPSPSPVAELFASSPTAPSPAATAAPAAPAAPSPTAQFAQANQPTIVSAIRGTLLPAGGTMSITLTPPELGALQVTVRVENGVISASFETSNEQATRLLSHNLSQLKTSLETQGVSVDRLHVHQSSGSENSSSSQNSDGDSQQSPGDGRSAQQEQQRREVLRRMWRRVRGDRDPLDLVA